MRKAGKLASQVLDFITPHVKENVSTLQLDKLCHDFIISKGAIPAPLNYKGFPKSICTSVNHVVCHGIPGNKLLKSGDIINIDITVILDKWHGDTSRMFFVGKKILNLKDLWMLLSNQCGKELKLSNLEIPLVILVMQYKSMLRNLDIQLLEISVVMV